MLRSLVGSEMCIRDRFGGGINTDMRPVGLRRGSKITREELEEQRAIQAAMGEQTSGGRNLSPRGSGVTYIPHQGERYQDQVTVTVDNDPYQNSPLYTKISDDGTYRTYQFNKGAASAENIFLTDTFADTATGQEGQQAANAAAIAAQDAEAARVAGLMMPDAAINAAATEEEAALAAARAEKEAADQAAYKIFTEDTANTATGDPQADLVTQTIKNERTFEFEYPAGSVTNVPSRAAAEAWVAAGIVAKGATFTLPDGTKGRAQ